MRYNKAEKLEIIRLVEGSDLGVNRTLKELGIHKRTFYNWYHRYREKGEEGLHPSPAMRNRVWNQIPPEQKEEVVHLALDLPEYSSRELALHIIDYQKVFISESSVYRILKQRGLITTPALMTLSASDSFKDKTSRVNEMWQTDFTYFKVIGWGWYYLSTVLDDYSRCILAYDLCEGMKAPDVMKTVDKALAYTGIPKNKRPKLLSDNGSCYISSELNKYLESKNIKSIHGRPCHPQTQGKIERYHRTMKNTIKLDHYYSPEELERAIEKFVWFYNNQRYHESLNNLTPASVYNGQESKILAQREKTKIKTMMQRRKLYNQNYIPKFDQNITLNY
jgi:putative transposase